jgi:hypothetical protein
LLGLDPHHQHIIVSNGRDQVINIHVRCPACSVADGCGAKFPTAASLQLCERQNNPHFDFSHSVGGLRYLRLGLYPTRPFGP